MMAAVKVIILWASSLVGSFVSNFAKPNMKMSAKLIHAGYIFKLKNVRVRFS